MTEETEYKFAFRLKAGSHHDRIRGVTLEPGQIFNTNEDMIKLHGRGRWEKIKEGEDSLDDLKAHIKILEGQLVKPEPVEDPNSDLELKSIKELRVVAASLVPPVDLSTCTGKSEIINAIRSALDAA